MKFLMVSVFVWSACNLASASVYKIKLERATPASEAKRCEAFAEATAQELTRQTGATVLGAGCVRDEFSNPGLDVVITYQADGRLPQVSTHVVSSYGGAFYATLDSCTNELEKQKDLFSKNTGLSVLSAYCMPDLSLSNHRWETRIDGVGTPKVKAGVAAVMLWGSVADAQPVFANLVSAAKAYNLEVFESGFDGVSVGKHLVVRYYGEDRYLLEDYNDAKFQSAASCQKAAESAQKFLAGTSKPTVVFCELENQLASLHATYFSDILHPASIFRTTVLATRFDSAESCQKGLEKLPASSDIFGGVCSDARGSYRLHLFTKP